MSGNENLDPVRRIAIGGAFGAVAIFSLAWSCVMLVKGVLGDALVMGFFGLAALAVVAYYLYRRPIVDMDDAGVHVRIFLKTRSYPWSSFKQAGVIRQLERGKFHGRMVLVKENGSLRGEDDAFFVIRNLGRIIQLPGYSWMIKEYVEQHYGPLDFDDTARM